MKKIVSILLAVLLLVGIMPTMAFAVESEVPEGYIGVYDIEDLYCIRYGLDKNYILMADIDMTEDTAEGGDWDNGYGWAPIGENGNLPFTGTFDGNGHTIKGMQIRGIKTEYAGLFGYVKGEIKNFTLSEAVITTANGSNYAGAVAGYADTSKISDINVDVSFTLNNIRTSTYAGGAIGYGINVTLTNIKLNGELACDVIFTQVGNMHLYAGGIAGILDGTSVISKCVNDSDITAFIKETYSPYSYNGGIAGYQNKNCTIENSYNTGDISATAYQVSYSYSYSGGIAGYSVGTIKNCYNTGAISSTSEEDRNKFSYSGGIAGQGDADRCINLGDVTGVSNDPAISSIAYGTIANCYYLRGTASYGKHDTTDTATTAVSLSSAQMKLKSVYGYLDFDNVWFIDTSTGINHPQLISNPETAIEHTHSYVDEVTAPTCTAKGYTTHTCSCGDSYVDTYVNATGHSFGSWQTTKAATCTAKGTETRSCSRCSATETKDIAAKGHSYTTVVTAPTCTAQGYTTHTCSACGDSYKDTYVNATGHKYTSKVSKEATCTATGIKTFTCSCGDSYTETINALGHNYKTTVTKPTCTEKGYTTHKCSRCGDSYVDSYVNAAGHKEGEWKVTTPATTTSTGIKTLYCSVCGAAIRTEVIPKIDPSKGKVKSVSVGDVELNYKGTAKLNPIIDADSGIKYTVTYKSSDNNVATVDNNGNVKGAKSWTSKSATITCTVTDEFGNVVTDICKVTCGYAWWQWIIGIVLFGWIWY